MIHLKCPNCKANRERDGFKIRGQWCACGWRRDLSQSDQTPEDLTDEEILNLSQEHQVSYTMCDGGVIYPLQAGADMKDDVLSFARALIAADRARWGCPAVEPETNGQT